MGMDYELGPFRLDTDARVLMHDGHATELGARGVAVLAALISRAGEYVEKAAIVEAAWPGVVVEEANLAVQISAIRRVLARVPNGDRWIETLTRRGYRFVGPVNRRYARAAPSRAEGAPPENPNNVPARVSSFVGRTREVDEVKRLLARNRLVTLVGIGGVGKTRVALQVARETIDRCPGGVWVVELESIADARLVSGSIAQVLNIQEQNGEPLARTLGRQLRRRSLLLVLDTCEHVIAEVAAVVRALLAEAPDCRVLATSREALKVDGEQQIKVQPLSLPDGAKSIEDIAAAEAVELFVERARLQQPAFALTNDVAASVAELCSRLEGIPLAIELAAARMSSLSIDEIGRRLDDRLGLLGAGARGTPARQKTLRATCSAPDTRSCVSAEDWREREGWTSLDGRWTLRGRCSKAAVCPPSWLRIFMQQDSCASSPVTS